MAGNQNHLVTRGVYKIAARNFQVGVFNGHQFIGIREKLGSTFLDTEYLWEEGPPHGTVKEKPREHVADLVPWVTLDLYTGIICVTCRHVLAEEWRTPREEEKHSCGCDCQYVTGMLRRNETLYNAILPFVDEKTKAAWERSRLHFARRNDRLL